MANLIGRLFSMGGDRDLNRYRKALPLVEGFAAGLPACTDEEIRVRADGLRERARGGEPLDALLPEAFALAREASGRAIGLRHFDVQLIGAMALHDGNVAEMATGEGKTLVAATAAFLNALPGEGVHVVTVNDYLAKRDAEWMGALYHFLGLTVGLIQAGMGPDERRSAYAADVTYGTNSEFGFDYLKDNMVPAASERVQRGHRFAIVDEADSILIDEARVPLVISGPGEAAAELYGRFAELVTHLDPDKHVVIDEGAKLAYATEEGLDLVEELLGQEIYADASGRLASHLRQALRAQFLFRRDVEYAVIDGKVCIVDEFTGRVLPGRRYSEGLHQAIEAKEGVAVLRESMSMATITLQSYFRMYGKVAGMTGTARGDEGELVKTYGMHVVVIPTNRPVIRKDRPDYLFRTAEAKYRAVADEVERLHAEGRPVLVGTASIRNSERLSSILGERGIEHNVLNAKLHEEEAHVVAQAGRRGAVTIATNMAGRGTDILLGGSCEMIRKGWLKELGCRDEAEAEQWQLDAAAGYARNLVADDAYDMRVFGGLSVIGTERHDARRIDDQLRGRAGRQGDPGESRFYLSLEDDLFVRFAGEGLQAASTMMAERGLGEDAPVDDPDVVKVLEEAQKQVEAMHAAQRDFLMRFDEVQDRQRRAVYGERNAILDGKDVCAVLPEAISEAVGRAVARCCPAAAPSDDWDMAALSAWVADLCGEDASFVAGVDHDEEPSAVAEAVEDFLLELVAKREEALPGEAFKQVCSQVMLQVLDSRWVMHLQEMERLRGGINLRAIGRRDPLLEYKEESYGAFEAMVEGVYEDFLRVVLRLQTAAPVQAAADEESELELGRGDDASAPADLSRAVDTPLG